MARRAGTGNGPKDPTPPTDGYLFPGFDAPQANYHRTPNNITLIMAQICGDPETGSPKASAFAVLCYILRHTWGYGEFEQYKCISMDEFCRGRSYRDQDRTRMDNGTGLSESTVLNSLKYLERKGYIEVKYDDGDRGRIRKYYRLRIRDQKAEQAF
jgi:DNA-binding transcriptional ArsR family regulator